jgi:DNA-binding response OmpR family regulator
VTERCVFELYVDRVAARKGKHGEGRNVQNTSDLTLEALLEEQERELRTLVQAITELGGRVLRLERRQGEINRLRREGADRGANCTPPRSVLRALILYKDLARNASLSGAARVELWPAGDGGRARLDDHAPVELTAREFELVRSLAAADVAEDGFPRWIDYESLRGQIRKRDGKPVTVHNLHVLIARVRDKLVTASTNPYLLHTCEGLGARLLVRRAVLHARPTEPGMFTAFYT